MVTDTPNFGLGAEGQVCGCEAKLAIAKENGGWSYAGKLAVRNKSIKELLPFIGGEFERGSDELGEIIGNINEEIVIAHRKDQYYFHIQNHGQSVIAFKSERGTLVAAQFQREEETEQTASGLRRAADEAGRYLGIEAFTFFLKSGAPRLPSLSVPKKAWDYDMCVCGTFHFSKSGIAFKEVFERLFGLKQMEMILAYQKSGHGFLCEMAFPAINNSILKSKDMHFYLRMGEGSSALGISGEFCFPFLNHMEFGVDCLVGGKTFSITASSKPKQRIELLPHFYIQDTSLLIGVGEGITFGLITRLEIGRLDLFAGIRLSVYGEAVNLSLITAALYEMTIPLLADSLLGFHIPGVELLDFIQIQSFDLNAGEIYSAEKDIAAYISRNTIDDSWKLTPEKTQIRHQERGIAVLDEERMCHYYIDNKGKLSLQAQFYYASESCEIGRYTIQKGIFVCAVLTIFGKKIRALLSVKEKEGLIAFAQIEEMDLGFLKISASDASENVKNPVLADGRSILGRFVKDSRNSAVFFLSADKKDVSFYLDGKIEVCRLFMADARLIYTKGFVMADVRFQLMKVLEVHLKFQVEYGKFSNNCFQFYLLIDAGKLEEKLTAVKENIDHAIQKCRMAIEDATRKLDDAKKRVDSLYCEIQGLDSKIEDCRQTIRNTSWWKRWAVAIYKGAEILAYEAAKGALYVAIGTAKAVLEVAKAAVQFGGILGEGVLNLAKGVVDASMKLFFLRKIELAIAADEKQQSIEGHIEFVALGKEYKYDTRFQASLLTSERPEEAIAGNINGRMQEDLDNIDKGSFRSSRDKYKRKENLTRDRKNLAVGIGELKNAVGLVEEMKSVYVQETKEMMPEFEIMNGEYERAVSTVADTMTFIAKSIAVDSLEEPMKILKEKAGQTDEIDAEAARKTVETYEEAKKAYAQMRENIANVQKMRESLTKNHAKSKAWADDMMQRGENGEEAALERVFDKVEGAMCKDYFKSTPKDTGYLNFSKEQAIWESFEKARTLHDFPKSKYAEAEKVKAANTRYRKRI